MDETAALQKWIEESSNIVFFGGAGVSNHLTEKRGSIMSQSYTPEFKKKIVRLHIEEGRTYKSITAEYGVSKASISKWCAEFSEECHTKAQQNPDAPNDLELMKENLRLRKELEEAKKENLFLKKQRHSSQRKSIRGLSIY